MRSMVFGIGVFPLSMWGMWVDATIKGGDDKGGSKPLGGSLLIITDGDVERTMNRLVRLTWKEWSLGMIPMLKLQRQKEREEVV